MYLWREGGSAAHDVASGEWRYPVSQVLAQMMIVASLVIVLEVLSQGAAAYTASLTTTVVTSYAAAYACSVTNYHAAAAAAGRRTARSTFESTHEALAYFSAATVRQVQPEPSPGRASPLHSPNAGVLYLFVFSDLA